MSFVRFVKVSSLIATITVAIGAFSSCSRGPTAIVGPAINASGAGSKAMELYDKDGDGKIGGAELDAAPALKAAMATLDTDDDKAVSADEVAARVKAWEASQTGLIEIRCKVTLDGQPLAGAKVTFEPDPCLGDQLQVSDGETNMYGIVSATIPPEKRPKPDWPSGGQLGLYKVKISKVVSGKETLPARYNTQTTLGQEVANDDPKFKARNLIFALKSAP
jgi:hypothetical protein